MKNITTLIILVFFAIPSKAQKIDLHKSYISSSIGVGLPIGEFGSTQWYDNKSVGLACAGLTSDLITYGKFINNKIGIAGRLNTTITSMYDNGSVDKKPFWTSIELGVGGLYRITNSHWDYGTELWFGYMWLSGTTITIDGHQLINSPFYGTVVDFSPNVSYHITPKNSLVLKGSIATSIGRIKHGWANYVPKKQYQMLKFQVGLRHWIN